MRTAVALAVALSFTACGSEPGGDPSNIMVGTIAGYDLQVLSATFIGDGSNASIYLSSSPDECGERFDHRVSPNARILWLVVSGTAPIGAGHYESPDVFRSPGAEFSVRKEDCHSAFTELADATTIDFESFSSGPGGRTVGRYEVTIGSDHVSGRFDATFCAEEWPHDGATCTAP
jgi:hypothetical protein